MSLHVRQAQAADAPVLVDFNARLAQETEGKQLDPITVRQGVAAMLADTTKGVYWVAQEGGHVVGQLGVTREWSDWRNGWFWWIQSVYVHPDARRRGVFRALFDHVLEAARLDPEVIGVRLYVDHDNHAAQATYAKLGLEKTGYWLLERYPLKSGSR